MNRATRTTALGAALALIAGIAALIPSTGRAEGPEGPDVVRRGVTSVESVVSLPRSPAADAVQSKLRALPALPAGHAGEERDLPNADALGGAHAAGSAVVSAGAASSGFPGIDLLTENQAGTGAYSGSGGGVEPPDQALCVGNGFVMEGVNQAWQWFDTRGAALTPPILLIQFFKGLPFALAGPQNFISDPKCVYDPETKRFFATVLEVDEANTGAFTRAHNWLAVSKTSDPTKDWYLYSYDVTDDGQMGTPLHPTCPCLGDQPLIGFDHYGFYMSTNEYSDAELLPTAPPPATEKLIYKAFTLPDFRNGQAQLYALSKKALINGQAGTVWTADTASVPLPAGTPAGSLWSSLQPSFTPPHDKTAVPAGGVEYFLSSLDFQAQGDNRVGVWALTNTRSLDSANPDLHLLNTIITTRKAGDTYTYAVSADQKKGPEPIGGTCLPSPCDVEKLNANDDRMNQVMLANGDLWSGVNTLLPAIQDGGADQLGDPRTGIMYFRVHPQIVGGKLSATMVRDGYVNVPKQNVLFPSIAASAAGPVVVAFTVSGVDYFPSAGWARLDDLADGAAPAVHVAAAGKAPEDGFTGYCLDVGLVPFSNLGGQCTDQKSRWGDYSASAVDENGCIWQGTEYISNIHIDPGTGNWSTFVNRVQPAGCEEPPIVPKPFTSPHPCLPLFTGDAGSDDYGGVGAFKGQNPQLDIIKGDMKMSKDGKFLTTILTIKDLSENLPTPAGNADVYYFQWLYKGTTYYSEAYVDATGVKYGDGVLTTSHTTRALTDTGSFNPGPNGTVVVNVPLSFVGKPKKHDMLSAPSGDTRSGVGAGVAGLVLGTDVAGPNYDYQVGQVCVASTKPKPVKVPVKVKGTKTSRHLPATGVADTRAYLIGVLLMVGAAAVGRKLSRSR